VAHPRRVRRSFSIAVGCILALALAAPGAGAEGNPQATKLFEQGRALAEQGKYKEACELYEKSYRLERAAGTMLNLGDCAEREGKLREAWQMYDAAAFEFVKGGKAAQAKFARGRADALAPKLATVVVRLADLRARELTVRIAGRAVPPATEIVERLDPGAISIEVSATGREPFSTSVTAALGEQVLVEVPALKVVERHEVAPPPVEQPVHSRRKRSRVVLAAGFSGAGAIALGVAGVFALRARSAYNDYEAKQVELGCIDTCSDENRAILDPYFDRAARRADLATGFVIGGAALAVGGAILYLTAPRERVTVAPTASPSGAGLAAAVRF
jgi:tetratricopeptide (TPR) repeat protein